MKQNLAKKNCLAPFHDDDIIGTLSNDDNGKSNQAMTDNQQYEFAFRRSFPIIPTSSAFCFGTDQELNWNERS